MFRMMGCGTSDSLHTSKLRPLFQWLPHEASLPNSRVTSAFSPCCLDHSARRMEALLPAAVFSHCTRKGMDEKVRRAAPATGPRWNPTKEQLRALEEMYERGTRTPPVHQIQLIAAQLRRYGRIEGKNVFYWFQNHKARERQRLRRLAEEAASPTTLSPAAPSHSGPEKSDKQNLGGGAAASVVARAGCFRRVVDGSTAGVLKQESKSWVSDKPCSNSIPAASPTDVGGGEATAYSPWLPSQQQHRWPVGNAAWQHKSRHQRSSLPRLPPHVATPSSSGSNPSNGRHSWGCRNLAEELAGREKPATLELFPLRSDRDAIHSSSASKPHTSPHVQFFQFL